MNRFKQFITIMSQYPQYILIVGSITLMIAWGLFVGSHSNQTAPVDETIDISETTVETTVATEESTEPTTEETTDPTTEPTETTVYIPETEPPTEPAPTIPPETEPETVPATEAPTEPIPEATEPVDIPTEETQSLYSDEEIELLAMAIYMEVGSDSICNDCRRYARDVILNRVADSRYPNTIYGVLTQPGQYSAFGNGVYWPSSANSPYEAHAVERAREIAREVQYGQYSGIYGNGYIYQAQFVQGYEGFWCCTEYYGKG